MKLLPIALPCAFFCLCGTHAAYLSIENHSKPWTSFQDITLSANEGLLLALPIHDMDSHYLCDVVIENQAFQISVHSESPDNWIATPMVERSLPQEYVSLINEHLTTSAGLPTTTTFNRAHSSPPLNVAPIISCKPCPINQQSSSVLQQRIGFMHVIDLLSIVGVGFLAAAATGVAALFRRHDHLKRSGRIINMKSCTPPQWGRLDHFHERPSMDNHDETEYVFNYIRNKLG